MEGFFFLFNQKGTFHVNKFPVTQQPSAGVPPDGAIAFGSWYNLETVWLFSLLPEVWRSLRIITNADGGCWLFPDMTWHGRIAWKYSFESS